MKVISDKRWKEIHNELEQAKKHADDVDREYAMLEANHSSLIERHEKVKKERDDVREELNVTKERVDELESPYSDSNSLTLLVEDDLTTMVPYIKVKESVFEKMIELGYLKDNVTSETKSSAMQLALMMIAFEGLEQLVEQFSEPPRD